MNREKLKVLSDEEAKEMKERVKKFRKEFKKDLERRYKRLFKKGGDKTSPTSKD